MQQLIDTLRNKRIKSRSLTRGALPKVGVQLPVVIVRILLSILIFIVAIAFMFFINLFMPIVLFSALVGGWCYLLFWGKKMKFFQSSEVANTFWFLILILLIVTCFSLCWSGILFLFASIIVVFFYLIRPIFTIIHLQLSTNKLPPDWILERFPLGYAWLKSWLIALNLVATTNASLHKQLHLATNGFGLWLGTSTGKLSTLWHKTGIAPNQEVTLRSADVYQNILVLGGIGSGKTTCVMQPLLLQCLEQNCGGLIFDIKGDVKKAATQMAVACNKNITIIGPNQLTINLLAGLSPEIAASFLKSAFLLNGRGQLDSFWIDTATELCRNTLGMLSFLPEHYNLQSLYLYLFEQKYQNNVYNQLVTILDRLPTADARLLKNYSNYHQLIFANFDPKIKSGVYATVAQALAPFSHPVLFDTFCNTQTTQIDLTDLFQGQIYLIDLPLARWGLGGKVVYTLIKLRFFNLLQNRQHLTNEQLPIFFMCDEFQEIISANQDGLSDLNFWDKSRSSKTIGIISSQSIASIYAAIGSHDLANAILQNFRQKICLRTEDLTTLNFIARLLGDAKIKKIAKSSGSNQISTTISEAKENVLDPQVFRDLNPKQAVAILSIADFSMDDVLNLLPVYVN